VALSEDINTAKLRRNLDSCLRAVQNGQQFRLFNYNTQIGRIGLPEAIPEKLKATAKCVSFSEARNSLSLFRRAMMKGEAVIITKKVRGHGTLLKQGRRRKLIAKDTKQIAAVWPNEEGALVALMKTVREISRDQKKLRSVIAELLELLGPIREKIEASTFLDEEIAKKRKLADNLDATIQRRMVGGQ
jgi:hypothetical protein